MAERAEGALDIRAELQRVIRAEAEGLGDLSRHLDDQWVRAVHLLADCRGKVITLAVGKSGHVGRKMAATMASLGLPAFFVHAGEAAHGDLGMIGPADVVIAISHSGSTVELISLLPALRQIGCPVIALTSRPGSALGQAADCCLNLGVQREADHLNLAPTVSSTATLCAGDALAVAVARLKGFRTEDFAFRHPAGALGRRRRP